jgi:hypothetical protein
MHGVFRLLKPGGVFVLNIADVTGAKLERDARALAKEAGFTFREFFKLAMSRVPGARQQQPRHAVQVDGVIWKHEPCFVFEKPPAAVPDCQQTPRKGTTARARSLHFAAVAEAKRVYEAFRSRRDMFPHVRFDAIQRRCRDKECIYQRGVALTFQRYNKSVRLGEVLVPAGSVILHQIVSTKERGAADDVFRRFREWVKRQDPHSDIYLTVRESNQWARVFYERHGMEAIGSIAWKRGELRGVVYRHRS